MVSKSSHSEASVERNWHNKKDPFLFQNFPLSRGRDMGEKSEGEWGLERKEMRERRTVWMGGCLCVCVGLGWVGLGC